MIATLMGMLALQAAPLGATPVAELDAHKREYQRLVQAIEAWNPATPYLVINTQDNLLLLREGNQVLPLPEGTILLKAELVGNDHYALDPETYSVAEVTVSDEAGCLGGTQDSRDTGDTAQE